MTSIGSADIAVDTGTGSSATWRGSNSCHPARIRHRTAGMSTTGSTAASVGGTADTGSSACFAGSNSHHHTRIRRSSLGMSTTGRTVAWAGSTDTAVVAGSNSCHLVSTHHTRRVGCFAASGGWAFAMPVRQSRVPSRAPTKNLSFNVVMTLVS